MLNENQFEVNKPIEIGASSNRSLEQKIPVKVRCKKRGIDPISVSEETVMQYRRYLVKKRYSAATIALKLTVVRRLYAAAVERGLMTTRPLS